MTVGIGDPEAIATARQRYAAFLQSTETDAASFRLTTRAEPTAYARCFGIYGLQLLQDRARLADGADRWSSAIRADLDRIRRERVAAGVDLTDDKPYLQLLTFSLSALAALGRLDADPLDDHVLSVLSRNIESDLVRARALDGKPGSGNQAMFLAILLLHARDNLGIDDAGRLALWQSLFLESMNPFGFWSHATSMSHLQFQNGYHIYEIFEYMRSEVPRWNAAADCVASLADDEGHFAPYPGGGGCYDYDAAFLITGAGAQSVDRHRELLRRSFATILCEQNADGGFCESTRVRPRSAKTVGSMWRHAVSGRGAARIERSRYGLTLLRPRYDRIDTHWSAYSREWGESDLWDSWFRMLTLARIQVALEPQRSSEWGFIDFPGIGHHWSLRATDFKR